MCKACFEFQTVFQLASCKHGAVTGHMFLNSLIKLTGSAENCEAIYRALRAARSAVDRFMDISFTTPASYLFKYIRTFENICKYQDSMDDDHICLR